MTVKVKVLLPYLQVVSTLADLRSLLLSLQQDKLIKKLEVDDLIAGFQIQIWGNPDYLKYCPFEVPDLVELKNDRLRESALTLTKRRDPDLSSAIQEATDINQKVSYIEMQISTLSSIENYMRSTGTFTVDLSCFPDTIAELFATDLF